MVGYFNKYMEVEKLPDLSAKTLIHKFKMTFSRYGVLLKVFLYFKFLLLR